MSDKAPISDIWTQGGVEEAMLRDVIARADDEESEFLLLRLHLLLSQRDNVRFRDRGQWTLLASHETGAVAACDDVPMFRIRWRDGRTITGVYTRVARASLSAAE